MRLSLNKSGNAPKNPSSQNKTKSNNSGSSSTIFSNFFIKPKDKKSEYGDKSIKERDTTRKHGFTVPFSKPVKPLRGNEIPFGKATIFRKIDKENKIPNQESDNRSRQTQPWNLESNISECNDFDECPKQKGETTQSSKRTFSEFDDVGFGLEPELNRQPRNECKRLKTDMVWPCDVQDNDDEDVGTMMGQELFNDVEENNNSINNNDIYNCNIDGYAEDPESDFDFIAPSPRSPEYLSPDDSPPYFNDIDTEDSLPETVTRQKEGMVTEVDFTCDRIQADEIKEDINEYDEFKHRRSEKAEETLDAKFEKSSSDYIAVLEKIADTFKAFDQDLLLNLLGEDEHEEYKKNQVERNRLRAQRRRLSIRIEEKRRSIGQKSSQQTGNGWLLQNSTSTITSSRRASDGDVLPLCGDSFFDKSPPVLQPDSSQLSKVSANSHASFTPQTSKSRSTTPSFPSTWRTNTPAFQNRNKSNVIDIEDYEDQEDQPPGTGTNANTSSTTSARFSGGSCEASQTNNGSKEKASTVGQRTTSAQPKKTGNSLPDDGYRDEFKRTDYAFTQEVNRTLRRTFGLKCFRFNQHEAITAALLKRNCFILMPTGGGKSLCYQLPAVVTDGVTIVVSPLKSLIQDQVMKLSSNHIPAHQMTGETSANVVNAIYRDLHSVSPQTKLLYVTPEKLSGSGRLSDALESLYGRGKLARFVIDEAHCVSQWGHDFRPDYKKLSALNEKFPLVPMMAVTATATPRVRTDIVTQLRMKEPMWFSQSFNRPNLQFLLRPKKGKLAEQITEIIKANHAIDSGIIYCLSRNDCDNLADNLRQTGIQATAYHAGLSDLERKRTQEDWIRDRCKVICATIAFGMGIDKADVRFVFHHSLPKSLEGYFQECGRAGRDGQNSVCILFYNYGDVHRLKRMVLSDKTNTQASINVHMNNLYRVVQYCENVTECRRAQLLEYFGETGFDTAECHNNQSTICDNCSSADQVKKQDVTPLAKLIVESVNTLIHKGNGNWQRPMAQLTLKHLVDVFKGSQNAKVDREKLNRCVMYGKAGDSLSRNDAERLFRMLVMKDILIEDLTVGHHSQVIAYAKLGPKAMEFLNGRVKLPPFFTRDKKSSKSGTVPKSDVPSNVHVTNTCYEQLVACCKRVAEEEGLKPHHIFADVTLRLMADKLPMTREEMLDIEGVTEYKMETFGSHFLELTLAYAGAAIFTSEDNMISDGDDMMEAGRQDNEDDCASPYWAAAGINFTTSNGKSKKFRRKRNFNGKKKTKTRSKNNKTDAKKTDASSYNANNHISNPTVNKYRDFSKKRNLGSGRRLPGFLSIPAKK